MAIQLPRLNAGTSIVDGQGRPTSWFQQWWQQVADTIETAVNDIIAILVRLGLVEVTADNALELSESAINPDGTIKTGKVLTDSIEEDGVTQRYFSQTLSDIPLPDGVETDVASVSVTKVLDDSDIDIEPSIRLESSDDVRGEMKIYRDATLIDSFEPYMDGTGGTFRVCQTIPYTDSGAPAGTYTYKLTFTRNGGASSLNAAAGSLIRAKEFKR